MFGLFMESWVRSVPLFLLAKVYYREALGLRFIGLAGFGGKGQ